MTKNFLLRWIAVPIVGLALVCTGCSKYDDDIDRLNKEVSSVKSSLEELKNLVNNGKSITGVQTISGGFRISFSDGSSYDIVSGAKGDTGAQGPAGPEGPQGPQGNPGAAGTGSVVRVDDAGHLWIDDKDCGKVVNETGTQPSGVVVTIDAQGYICVNGVRQENARIASNTSYAVEHDEYIEFYVVNEQGERPAVPVKVWKSAALTGLMTIPNYLFSVNENGLLFPTIYGVDATGKYVRLYAGKATVSYEINPKSANLKVDGYVSRLIATRAAGPRMVISPDPVVADGCLTVQAKAMDGLFSYNNLNDVRDADSYVYGFDDSKGIDPLANIIALGVTSQQSESLISDYVMAFDYNIPQSAVTIEKQVVRDGVTDYENTLPATEQAAKDAATADFELEYNDGNGTIDLGKKIRAFYERTGISGKTGKFALTENGFDEHAFLFEKVKFEFTDEYGNKKDHGSYVTLTDEGVMTVREEADEKGSSITRTPIVKITMASDAGTNHGKVVKVAYAKIKIVEQTIDKDIPAYTQSFGYELNDVGAAKYLQLDKLYGHVAEHLGVLGSDKFHTIYPNFQQLDETGFDTEIQMELTRRTSTGKQEWLAVSVPNYKQAGTYKVKGVFRSNNDEVYPPVYVIYTVEVTYPAGPYLTRATNPDDGSGNFWQNGVLIVNGLFDADNDNRFDMRGKMSNAFIYALPYDRLPFDKLEWDKLATDPDQAKVNVEYTIVDAVDRLTSTIVDDADNTMDWLGNISVAKFPENIDYRDIRIQPVSWFNLGLDKMINAVAFDPAEAVSKADGLQANTESEFTVRFISPLKSMTAADGTLDANTTVDLTLDLLRGVKVTDRYGKTVYADKSFKNVDANGVSLPADEVYQIGKPVFEWADQATRDYAARLNTQGGKCYLDPNTGVITFNATGEAGIVNLKVKVSMSCPWRLLETTVTVAVK